MRLNLSKTGVSLSVGKPGLTVNVGRGRRRTIISAPGTGISYSESERLETEGGPVADAEAPPERKSLVQAVSNWLTRGK